MNCLSFALSIYALLLFPPDSGSLVLVSQRCWNNSVRRRNERRQAGQTCQAAGRVYGVRQTVLKKKKKHKGNKHKVWFDLVSERKLKILYSPLRMTNKYIQYIQLILLTCVWGAVRGIIQNYLSHTHKTKPIHTHNSRPHTHTGEMLLFLTIIICIITLAVCTDMQIL